MITIPITKDDLWVCSVIGLFCIVIGLLLLASYMLIIEDGRIFSVIFGICLILFAGIIIDFVFLGFTITDFLKKINPFQFKKTKGAAS